MPTIRAFIIAILGPLASYKVILLNFLNTPEGRKMLELFLVL
jgi:hypothetical protein